MGGMAGHNEKGFYKNSKVFLLEPDKMGIPLLLYTFICDTESALDGGGRFPGLKDWFGRRRL